MRNLSGGGRSLPNNSNLACRKPSSSGRGVHLLIMMFRYCGKRDVTKHLSNKESLMGETMSPSLDSESSLACGSVKEVAQVNLSQTNTLLWMQKSIAIT
ncbi:hypothetical protein CDAR_282361 [Caerostris darwini]|uniref:Uncharacterized protein n=1 Tax=Caerostris darwini TaxID=1538125 RepID=A0AAV4MNS5_9ARAC|nr:hypothetical protein CDAR_282361 [Caerostris darwini]